MRSLPLRHLLHPLHHSRMPSHVTSPWCVRVVSAMRLPAHLLGMMMAGTAPALHEGMSSHATAHPPSCPIARTTPTPLRRSHPQASLGVPQRAPGQLLGGAAAASADAVQTPRTTSATTPPPPTHTHTFTHSHSHTHVWTVAWLRALHDDGTSKGCATCLVT